MIELTSVNLAKSINIPLKRYPNVFIKREDAISEKISGNKYRKLLFNLRHAKQNGFNTILTFGGAYSNHIAAVAASAKECGFNSIGIIRGEELAHKTFIELNPTLQQAIRNEMHLHFVSRVEYQKRYDSQYQDRIIKTIHSINNMYSKIYVVPEGGTNVLAIEGCQHILAPSDDAFDYIACPVGTGGTLAGLILSAKKYQTLLGFSALTGDFLTAEIDRLIKLKSSCSDNYIIDLKRDVSPWRLVTEYTFGGYAKTDDKLITFINDFYREEGIKLDPIYTGKMMYGILDMLSTHKIDKEAKILAIHTGGLQGIEGFNQAQRLKNKATLNFNG